MVLVVGLGRLAAGASSSSVSSSESVVLGLRPSRLLGPSSLGVLWLYLHLLFLVDVVSGDMDLLLCEHKNLDRCVAFAIKSAVCALGGLPSSCASCLRAFLEGGEGLLVCDCLVATDPLFFLDAPVLQTLIGGSP